jgi:hypothetical protein
MNVLTKRRKRRRAVAKLKNKKAVRAHKRQTGRTGMVQAKRTPASRVSYSRSRPNPPGPEGMNLGAGSGHGQGAPAAKEGQ